MTASGGTRFVRLAVIVVVAVLAGGGSIASAAPDDRDSPDPIMSGDSAWRGTRQLAVDLTTQAAVQGVVIGVTTNDVGDPPLIAPRSDTVPFPLGVTPPYSNCNQWPVVSEVGRHSVWYRLVGNAGLDPLPERTIVTLDAAGTTFLPNVAIVVYDHNPGPWDGTAENAPNNLVACMKGDPATRIEPFVSFVAEAGPDHDYWIEVTSLAGGGSLYLGIRTLDAQPPALTLQTPNPRGELGHATVFEYSTADRASGVDDDSLSLDVRFGDVPLVEVCPSRGAGTFCRSGSQITVQWPGDPPPGRVTSVPGTVALSVRDVAGNLARVVYQVTVRDRTPPTVIRAIARGGRGLVSVSAGCTEEGAPRDTRYTIRYVLYSSATGRSWRSGLLGVRKDVPRRYTFRGLPRGIYTVRNTCRDAAGNGSYVFAGAIVY